MTPITFRGPRAALMRGPRYEPTRIPGRPASQSMRLAAALPRGRAAPNGRAARRKLLRRPPYRIVVLVQTVVESVLVSCIYA